MKDAVADVPRQQCVHVCISERSRILQRIKLPDNPVLGSQSNPVSACPVLDDAKTASDVVRGLDGFQGHLPHHPAILLHSMREEDRCHDLGRVPAIFVGVHAWVVAEILVFLEECDQGVLHGLPCELLLTDGIVQRVKSAQSKPLTLE
eukprot:5057971-Amphidinium_carterae.1